MVCLSANDKRSEKKKKKKKKKEEKKSLTQFCLSRSVGPQSPSAARAVFSRTPPPSDVTGSACVP